MEKMTTSQVAELLNLTPSRIRQLCKDKVLKVEKFGRQWAIDAESVKAYAVTHVRCGRVKR